jgi:hypothetical protein
LHDFASITENLKPQQAEYSNPDLALQRLMDGGIKSGWDKISVHRPNVHHTDKKLKVEEETDR